MLDTWSPKLTGLFSELYVFGDSLTSYGDFAAYLQKTLIASAAQPPWSGVSFGNANFSTQVGLRQQLGLATAVQPSPPALNLPPTVYTLTNPYVATPGIATVAGPSFAIGGATSGTASLYDLGALSTVFPTLKATGLQNQILASLEQKVSPASTALTLIQGGSNDLLIAYLQQNPDIEGVLDQVMANMRQNLTVQLRAGSSRQLITFALADFRGVVDGVAYQMPFLTDLLRQASAPDAEPWLQPWKAFVEGGGLEAFQVDYAAMVQELAHVFPYASLTYHSPEFGTNWQAYGERLGNFDSYGINNTLGYAQLANAPLTPEQTNSFLYFDNIHNTESGQEMSARAMALTLQANRAAIAAATLVDQTIGTAGSDVLVAGRRNCELLGLAGRDRLTGRDGNDALSGGLGRDRLTGGKGTDWLRGGEDSDWLRGGDGADFFCWTAQDVNASWADTITDFQGQRGDRLGITAILDGSNPFLNPGWTYIGKGAFSGAAGELSFRHGWLRGDLDGDRRADLNIELVGVRSFDQSWIS